MLSIVPIVAALCMAAVSAQTPETGEMNCGEQLGIKAADGE